MPTRPPRAKTPGSPQPRPRLSSAQRGYDGPWQRASKAFLAKHPRCDCPAHRGKADAPRSTVVHHDPPHKGDKVKFWTRSTWHAWAKPCHDTHTGQHDRPESHRR